MPRILFAVALLVLPQAGNGPYDLEFTEVRDGVWMAHRPDPLRSPVFGNVTLIINGADVVVVDAGPSPRAARRIIDKIRELTDMPVTTLINTHGHEDHVLGNQAFLDAFPDIEIVARPGTVEYLRSGRVQARVRGFFNEMPERQQTAEFEAARVARRGLNGDALVAEHMRRYYEHLRGAQRVPRRSRHPAVANLRRTHGPGAG